MVLLFCQFGKFFNYFDFNVFSSASHPVKKFLVTSYKNGFLKKWYFKRKSLAEKETI